VNERQQNGQTRGPDGVIAQWSCHRGHYL